MTIKQAIQIADGNLVVNERAILTNMPDNVVPTSASTTEPVEGVFLGAAFSHDKCCHVVPLGTLRNVRFLALFRFKLCWMAQKMGEKGRDIPLETQFLLVETKDGSLDSSINEDDQGTTRNTVYTVFLPLVEGPFKACLQGNDRDEVELCLESGDTNTTGSTFTHSVYISSGMDPFRTIHDAMKAVRLHLESFRLRDEKKLPGIVDYFGWCTWDAFYQEVSQEGVEAGLRSLKAGGTPPKFVIIDDGWQSAAPDEHNRRDNPNQEKVQELGQGGLYRLTGITENEKFRKEDPPMGIQNIIDIAKQKYGLKYVYMWHAILGYWGGVRSGVKEMEEYESAMQYPKFCRGVTENEPGWKTDSITLQGVGLVHPRSAHKFFNEYHSYLTSAGVDGVKVDGQCILEGLGEGLGGRVELNKQYHQALDASVARHFPDNGCIACMSHNLDSLYCSKQTAIVRASDDFFPRDPVSHTIHIAAVAYNSIFLGEIMLPDWDMFHSLHPAAEYHGSARAISGGPVYVSDAPEKHDFDVLKKLVLPDGSILRACLPGRPTKDCLFSDPSRDGVSLLKIWNMNKHTGVLGVYNCQGAAWNSIERKNMFHQTNSEAAITSCIKGRDVHLISDLADGTNWDGNVAIFSHNSGRLTVLQYDTSLPVSLKVLEHEIFTITPIKTFITDTAAKFAPLGLIDMFNSGGAIDGLKYDAVRGTVGVDVKGCGRFGAYSSAKPRKCTVESVPMAFEYDQTSGLVSMNLVQMPPEDQKIHRIEIEF